MTQAGLLEEITRWVGVMLAIIGTVVVAPSGARRLWSSMTDGMRPGARRVRSWLARFLPFLRRNAMVHTASATVRVTSGGSGAVTTVGRAFHQDAPVAEQIAALHSYISRVEEQVNLLAEQLSHETTSREQDDAELKRALQWTVEDDPGVSVLGRIVRIRCGSWWLWRIAGCV
jgi:hypothetical protein